MRVFARGSVAVKRDAARAQLHTNHVRTVKKFDVDYHGVCSVTVSGSDEHRSDDCCNSRLFLVSNVHVER